MAKPVQYKDIDHGLLTRDDTKTYRDGRYATFNGGPHFHIDVPDGHFTITARTTEGRKITFAFVPYKEGGPAGCVDVKNHDTNAIHMNGDVPCEIQEMRAFSVGGKGDVWKDYDSEQPVTLMTVILAPSEKAILTPAKNRAS